ncbi:MAG: hypothetical protein KJO37_01865 [Bacteroidia bacterium]|nr:hypothetical protein [Bacteroidia bacterium]
MEIRVINAGLIILSPFISRYFQELDLIENEKFINEQSRNRAVYLLQYMVNNSVDHPEHLLALNKLLVGLPIESPLSPIADPTEREIEIGTSLLQAVIGHWKALKNSSTLALQETFLQREGVLTLNDHDHTLRIEKKGVDVLLSSLPWGISIVKLPWMELPIFVEW